MEKNIVANQDDRHEAIREKYSLLVMISTQKKVEKMANYALANGANSAFFSYARGTLPNHILLALGLANVKREIAVLSVPNSMAAILLDRINQKFDLAEKMGGIAYLISLEKTMTRPDVDRDHTYSAIVTIVNEGEGEDVVTNVRRKYYVGATILHASGSADHSRKTFDFEIVPSKEIVLIITKKSLCEAVYRTIHESLRTELPGRGVIFTTDLDMVAGIHEQERQHKKTNEVDDNEAIDEISGKEITEPYSTSIDKEAAEQDISHRIAVLSLVDRGHTGEVVRAAEAAGSQGATIMRGRFTEHESRGFLSHTGDVGKEAVIMIATKETALAIMRSLNQYATTHAEINILLTWMRIHSFSRFSYGKE